MAKRLAGWLAVSSSKTMHMILSAAALLQLAAAWHGWKRSALFSLPAHLLLMPLCYCALRVCTVASVCVQFTLLPHTVLSCQRACARSTT